MFCRLKPNFCFTYNWKSSFSCTSKIKKKNPTGFQHHLCSLCLYGRSQTLLCLRPTLYILVLKYIVTRFSLDSSIRAVLRYCVFWFLCVWLELFILLRWLYSPFKPGHKDLALGVDICLDNICELLYLGYFVVHVYKSERKITGYISRIEIRRF